ncbi:periplasmic binding protein-like II [Rhizoclosmatium globosum]|uniref:Periplasmic binding protein-like II n=1 Tax=Rhizoclosmatium globosum TaxID=329046 RepID=A0A1Y2BGC0_9FUNG|nr:periplasmic binding protein-like II [Rhizoclosmatium globosum]|eukprot:ORY33537.1 periplasmic binding protein-like II [Rhizoclosmatium globosum]
MKQMKSIFTLSILGFLALVNGQTDSDVISSGGASFPEEAYSAAMTDFGATYSSEYRLKLYDTTDSTTGQRNVVNGQYNWGGSDFGVNSALTTPNAPIVALPAIAGGLVITCNLPGIKDQVKLSRTVLPRIFDGTITLWNDPLLIRDNPFLAFSTQLKPKLK